MKLFCGMLALACVPVALAKNNAAIPNEKLAEFVVEKLDVTTLPSSIRPKPEKKKKTFSDYGYAARRVEEKEALVEATPGGRKLTLGSWSKKRLESTFALKDRGKMRAADRSRECSC